VNSSLNDINQSAHLFITQATSRPSKYKLSGHLFQGRYKSYLVGDDPYLITLIRYIHNNPVRANLAEFAFEYEYSSLVDYQKGYGLTDTYLIDNLIEKRVGGTPLVQILC